MFKRVMTLPAAHTGGSASARTLIDLGAATVETRGAEGGQQFDGAQPQRYNQTGLAQD